jgi:plasmid stability protein
MATIIVRNLDDEVAERLRARLQGVSVEQEARRILAEGTRGQPRGDRRPGRRRSALASRSGPVADGPRGAEAGAAGAGTKGVSGEEHPPSGHQTSMMCFW